MNLNQLEQKENKEQILEKKEYIIFQIGTGVYAIEIEKAQTIERYKKVTPIPQSKLHVKGLVNLRGELITVIDTNKKINHIDSEITNNSRIIILMNEEDKVGLLVDNVIGVKAYTDEDIVDVKDNNSYKSMKMTKNFIKDTQNNNILLILNLEEFESDI